MEWSAHNRRRPPAVSDEELREEIRQSFAKPLLPEHASLAADFKVVGPPASTSDLAALRGACGGALPPAYLDFLRCADGAAGCASDRDGDYLTLWVSRDVPTKNAALPPRLGFPRLLAVGTDGKGGWVGFDRAAADPESWPVVRVGPESGGRGARQLAPSFRTWCQGGFRLRPGGFVCGGG